MSHPFRRKSYAYLLDWKKKSNRKPLLIRGARQVGKSTLIAEFGKEFDFYISLNLEKQEDREVFEQHENIKNIADILFLRNEIPKDASSVLLFIDEIQECPKAIQLLRYFYEELSSLYVIAAGSLLEFALSKVPSFPVGRVEQFVLHPFEFEEFLMAKGLSNALEAYNTIPFPEYAYSTLMREFHTFLIVGGMPEAVRQLIQDDSFANLPPIYDAIWQGYKDDAEKYAKSNSEKDIIRHIFSAAPHEQDRITFHKFGNSSFKSREVSQAFRSIDLARIIRLIYPITSTKIPMIEDHKKRPRIQFLDVGLMTYELGFQSEMIGINDFHSFFRGKLIQQMVTQELVAQHNTASYKPHFWVREDSNSSSEVDLVYQLGTKIIPVEIKSGEQGRLRSLHQFIQRSEHDFAIRLLANKLNLESVTTPNGTPYRLLNLPYFLGGKLPQYAQWFVQNHPKS